MPKHSSDVVTIHSDMWGFGEYTNLIQIQSTTEQGWHPGNTSQNSHLPSLWGPESRLVVTTILPAKTVPKQKIWKTRTTFFNHHVSPRFNVDDYWSPASKWVEISFVLKIKLRGTPCHFELKPSRQNPRLPGPNGSNWITMAILALSYPDAGWRVIDKSSFLHSST